MSMPGSYLLQRPTVTSGGGGSGPTGPTGPQGTQGAQGAQGTGGIAGATGPLGPQGAQGNQGAAGGAGSDGAAGAQGAIGPQGNQGAAGTAGTAGTAGATGATGPQGAQGNQGAAGIQGIQGIQGTAGTNGVQGAAGASGPQGTAGTTGATGPTGPTGAQGSQGSQGVTGAAGAAGAVGDPVTTAAIVAGFNRSGVVSGCAVTASGTTMVLTVAAGVVEVNGQTIPVAGGTVTAVADGTNPRRSLVSINSSGAIVLTAGTPAASPVTATCPANSCALAIVVIPAGATALTTVTNLIDIRILMRQNFDAVTYYADDYATVEAAVTAANASVTAGALGATVLLGPKNYTTQGIDIGKNISIIGMGTEKSKITLANGRNRPVIQGVNFATLTGTAAQQPELRGDNNIQLVGFTIVGNKANQTSGQTGGVQIWGKRFRFVDLNVFDCFGHGLWTEWTLEFGIVGNEEREQINSWYDQIQIAGCTGNGWNYRGPHDAQLSNAAIYSCGGWAINIENNAGSVGGIVLDNVNAYLNTTGCYRVYGDMKAATAVVASGNAIGTGWDIGPSTGGIKMVNCDTFGFVKGLILRGNSHYYSGNISGNFDGSGAVMGVGLILGDGAGGAYHCIVDACGTGNDIAMNVGADWQANQIKGTFNIPTGKANPASFGVAQSWTGSPSLGLSDYNMVFLQGSTTTTLRSYANGITPQPGQAGAGLAPLKLASGTNLTTPEVGAFEFDGVQFYQTIDTTQGRLAVPADSYFHLTAAGSTISTIANFFGATSNIPLVANAYYLIDIELFYLKTTAGTVTWTLTNSAAPTGQNIDYEMSPVTGIVAPPGTTSTMIQGQFYNDATAARTIVTGSLTTGVNHYAKMRIWLKNGAGASLKIQATASAGSITPGIGSMWRCRRISPNNIGSFAA